VAQETRFAGEALAGGKWPGSGAVSGSVLDAGVGAVVGTVFRTKSRREGTTLTEFTRKLGLR